ncbi:hypothetical protein JKP88DRAFT_243253 [Tribonema minus]|uniref:Uncharacterized protein n=1 Tax=Tribonema minus TaxID=303371 RepID=A0A835ZIV3_9STRA|nr:hypothetical protein JKP88DRAFT_243253 [Tribonema minus]
MQEMCAAAEAFDAMCYGILQTRMDGEPALNKQLDELFGFEHNPSDYFTSKEDAPAQIGPVPSRVKAAGILQRKGVKPGGKTLEEIESRLLRQASAFASTDLELPPSSSKKDRARAKAAGAQEMLGSPERGSTATVAQPSAELNALQDLVVANGAGKQGGKAAPRKGPAKGAVIFVPPTEAGLAKAVEGVIKHLGVPVNMAELKGGLQGLAGIDNSWIQSVLVGSPSLKNFLKTIPNVLYTHNRYHLPGMAVEHDDASNGWLDGEF